MLTASHSGLGVHVTSKKAATSPLLRRQLQLHTLWCFSADISQHGHRDGSAGTPGHELSDRIEASVEVACVLQAHAPEAADQIPNSQASGLSRRATAHLVNLRKRSSQLHLQDDVLTLGQWILGHVHRRHGRVRPGHMDLGTRVQGSNRLFNLLHDGHMVGLSTDVLVPSLPDSVKVNITSREALVVHKRAGDPWHPILGQVLVQGFNLALKSVLLLVQLPEVFHR
mmetsp:Transcript_203/g.491  ORF Transcript_203/g.491 Transcript_203/m.491 type:complete len:226 (+) Transcript_203:122-799(+)